MIAKFTRSNMWASVVGFALTGVWAEQVTAVPSAPPVVAAVVAEPDEPIAVPTPILPTPPISVALITAAGFALAPIVHGLIGYMTKRMERQYDARLVTLELENKRLAAEVAESEADRARPAPKPELTRP